MYVYNFEQEFNTRMGEGHFIIELKQTGFNEKNIKLK